MTDNQNNPTGRALVLNQAVWSKLCVISDLRFPQHARQHALNVIVSEAYSELMEKIAMKGDTE
jgi:hypothetical protein